MIALFILLQAAATPAAAPQPERWSILITSDGPCSPSRLPPGNPDEIVVCDDPDRANRAFRLPDPDSIPSSGPMKSNPYLTGSGALAAEATPCPISNTCVVGFGPPIVPMIKGAVDLAKRVFAKKPDKTGRIAIPLDDGDAPTGRLEP